MSRKRVGSIGFATEQGLGYLMRDFHRNGLIDDVIVVKHSKRENLYRSWYPNSAFVDARADLTTIRRFCESVNTLICFETPFHWPLLDHCKGLGIKTIMVPMHECMPERWPTQPDVIVNPSDLEQRLYPQGIRLNCPVDTRLFTPAIRTEATQFVHNAGHFGLRERNGTNQVIASLRYITAPIEIVIRSQDPLPERLLEEIETAKSLRPQLTVRVQRGCPREMLYAEGDVFVFPEKFNGLSMPLQEAFANGMLIIALDRYPINTWLPASCLMAPRSTEIARIGPAFQPFTESIADVLVLAKMIDAYASLPRSMVEYLSTKGIKWGEANSFEALRPEWEDILR